MEISEVLKSYPRERPPLTPAHEAVFKREYKLNRQGEKVVESLSQKVEEWMHRKVAQSQKGPILELGAGTLNHLKFEDTSAGYDVVEPFEELYIDSPEYSKIRSFYSSQADIPETNKYKRIISVAVLEHMIDLPYEIALSGLKLEEGGIYQAGIPSEGGFLWWLGWRCTTGISYYLRNKLDYGVVMRHEHVSSAKEILILINYFFEDVKLTRFPFPHHHGSLYVFVEATSPRIDVCEQYLRNRPV